MITRKNSAIIAGFCILIVLSVSIAACVTQDSGTGNSAAIPVHAAPAGIDTIIETSSPDPKPASPVTLTINSARRVSSLYEPGHLLINETGGKILLVLDITVKNNGVPGGFVFTNKSIAVQGPAGGTGVGTSSAMLPKKEIGLENPLAPPVTITLNNSISGQVYFRIRCTNNYRVNLVDGDRSLLAYEEIRFDNLTAARHPVSFTINSVEERHNLDGTSVMAGEIFVIFNITLQNNDLPQGFTLKEESVTLQDLNGTHRIYPSINGKEKNAPKKLENPLLLPIIIQQNETVTGQLLFVSPVSDAYRLDLADNNRTILSSRIVAPGGPQEILELP
jgi:hypothetical protein